MDIGIASMRYAKALMEYAKSMGAEDTLYKEFCMLDRSFRKHPDLRMALENPILTIREKLTLICTAAVGDAPAGREFARFMTLVLKNRRENFLQYICLSFLDLYRKDKHIGVGKLITAVPVSQEVRERIHDSASSLLHASMELQTEVDPSIEGGFIFDINDFRLDASIATQLKKVSFIDSPSIVTSFIKNVNTTLIIAKRKITVLKISNIQLGNFSLFICIFVFEVLFSDFIYPPKK